MAANPLKLIDSEPKYDHEINARGLSCPLPMFSTRKSLEHINSGEILKFIVTDRNAISYFESLARQTGLQLLFWREHADTTLFYLRKP
ncbi:MAG TPA: sulfurtransferase TusA family protein [Methylophilaceae bacterium]|jgi:tRNA 2-thiouridine synthesizing protein A